MPCHAMPCRQIYKQDARTTPGCCGVAMYTMNVHNVDETPKLLVVPTAASVAGQAPQWKIQKKKKKAKQKPQHYRTHCPSIRSFVRPSGARTLEIPCRCAPHAETCVLIFSQRTSSNITERNEYGLKAVAKPKLNERTQQARERTPPKQNEL